MQWVQVVVLHIVEEHLHRRQAEVIGPEVEHRKTKLIHHPPCRHTPVVVRIVKHDDRALAPANVLSIKVLHELHEEQAEGLTVGDATVHSVPDLPAAAYARNEVDPLGAYIARDLVAASLGHPAALAVVSPLDHRLINTDHSQPLV